MRKLALIILICLAFPGTVYAVDPGEQLADPTLEARAREISRQLRCLVCQNQSIDDSDADLARDLRRTVRERLEAGDSNAEVLEYAVERYGEFILMRPRLSAYTLALWATPSVILTAGIIVVFIIFRRRTRNNVAPALNSDEEARLKSLLNGTD
jgi:cytochrome c-type biogenesis protein CcmH